MKNLFFSFFLLVLCMPINRCQAESTIQSRIDAGSTPFNVSNRMKLAVVVANFEYSISETCPILYNPMFVPQAIRHGIRIVSFIFGFV